MNAPIDRTTARVLNKIGTLGDTRMEGQRGHLGPRIDIGYPRCWCGKMPAEHCYDQLTHIKGSAAMLALDMVADHITLDECCSECADTGTTFDDEDQPTPCPRCQP